MHYALVFASVDRAQYAPTTGQQQLQHWSQQKIAFVVLLKTSQFPVMRVVKTVHKGNRAKPGQEGVGGNALRIASTFRNNVFSFLFHSPPPSLSYDEEDFFFTTSES